MLKEITLDCPYCGEHIDSFVDSSVGDQTYFEDCSVCCKPIHFSIDFDIDQTLTVSVKTENDC